MFCTYCGAQVSESANFCMSCGRQLPRAQFGQTTAAARQSEAQAMPGFTTAPPWPQSQAAISREAGLPIGIHLDASGNMTWIYHIGRMLDDGTDTGVEYDIRHELAADCVNVYNAIGTTHLGDGRSETEVVNLPGAEEVLMDAVSFFSDDYRVDSTARSRSDRLEQERKLAPMIERSIRYGKVKAIVSNRHDERIVLKLGGLSKARLCVSPELHDFILNELARRCPQATVERR